jgi:exodeoxyribonuclease VII small subunit
VSRKKTEPFEEALKKLEKIVDKLERGSLPLEEAMEAFAEGVRLVKHCNQKLDEAENRVQMLVKDGTEGWTTSAFDSSPSAEANRSIREEDQAPNPESTES